MEVFTLLALFTFGIVVGSFLNVLIDRLPQGESPWRGRSHCDHCQKNLAMLDLIPVLSFIFWFAVCFYFSVYFTNFYFELRTSNSCPIYHFLFFSSHIYG